MDTRLGFGEGNWLGTLKFQYPSLFNIIRRKYATVMRVLSSSPLNVSFKISLVRNMLTWYNIVVSVAFINLNEGLNFFVLSFDKDGVFKVKSMYIYLVNNGVKVT